MKTRSNDTVTECKRLFGVEADKALEWDSTGYNPDLKYYAIAVAGDCMDSDKSPIRVKNSDTIVIHRIPLTEISMWENVGKMVCVMLDGVILIKHYVFWNGVRGGIVVRMYNPEQKDMFIPLDKIKAMFVVDGAYGKEYTQAHTRPLLG